MEEKIKQIHRQYSLCFIISAIVVAAIAILRYRHIIPRVGGISFGTGMTVQTIVLLVLLCGIPASLAWFNAHLRKIRRMDFPEDRLDSYFKAQIIRLTVFVVLALLTLAVSIFTDMANARMAFLMVAAFYFFILPNKMQLLRETGLNPDGTIYDPESEAEAARQEMEARKVGNFTVMDEDDDFIPRNTRAEVVDETSSVAEAEAEDDDFIPKNS